MAKRWVWALALAFAGGAAVSNTSYAEEKKPAHEEHVKGPHGGDIVELGDEVAHLELVHDDKAGTLSLYVLGPDAKTAFPLKEAPKLNLKTDKGNVQIALTPANDGKDGTSSQFTAKDDNLKVEPLKGRIALKIGEKKYNANLEEHDHDHKK